MPLVFRIKIDTLVEQRKNISTSQNTGLQMGESIFKAQTLFAKLADRFLPVFNRGGYIGRNSQSKVIYVAIEAYMIERDERYQDKLLNSKRLLKKTGFSDTDGEIEQLIELIISENQIG